jgi:DNA-binding NtrC family response regulator
MRLLLVDDELHTLNAYETHLLGEGISDFIVCTSGADALSILAEKDVSLVLLDLRMPGMSGEEVLSTVSRSYPGVAVIVVTAVNDIETAVRCMKTGAFDYLLKPIDPVRLVTSVRRALEYCETRLVNTRLAEACLDGKLKNPAVFSKIITNSSRMRSLFRYVESISVTSQPVLITGETGVGKELIARAIHQTSGRKGGFIAVNAAGVEDETFSDTLFGHKRGAFTGADRERAGLIERAADGTIFLDEIGDLTAQSQVKLLRLVQEREYYQLGSDAARRTNARIVAATNRDLKAAAESSSYRADLYYRLLLHHVHVPPLRERRDDIPLLAQAFIDEAAAELHIDPPTVPPHFFHLITTYHFPGNVRELKSLIFDAVSRLETGATVFQSVREAIGQGSEVKAYSAQPNLALGELYSGLDRLPSLDESEDSLIEEAMRRTAGNHTLAAGLLGITRQTLHRRVKIKKEDNNPEAGS